MSSKPHKRGKPTFQLETLERRILFSADLPLPVIELSGFNPTAHVGLLPTAEAISQSSATAANDEQLDRHPVEIVIIDAATPDHESILTDLQQQAKAGLQVYVLDADRNGIEQISELLAQNDSVSALHVISHGADGELTLGDSVVDLTELFVRADDIAAWQDSFTEEADLLIYGCDLASSDIGRTFASTLGNLTGTDVAASDDLTGSALLGGDWDLEYKTGAVEAAVVLSDAAQQSWTGLLTATVDFKSVGNTTGAVMTFSHETSGTERLMIVGISMDASTGATVDNVKYNGIDLTHIGSRENPGEVRVELWQMVAPSTGIHDIVVTFDSVMTGGAVAGAMTFNGVDQVTPLDIFESSIGAGLQANLTNIDTTTGDLVFSTLALAQPSMAEVTEGSEQTEHWQEFQASVEGAGSTKVAESAQEQITWAIPNENWALAAVSITSSSNNAPTFDTSGIETVTEDALYSYSITASDLDAQALSFTADTLPDWLTLTDHGNDTATLSGTPENADVGTHSVVLEVSDGLTITTQSFDIVVTNTPDAPHAADDRLGVEFDGDEDHILIGTDASLEMTSTMTIEAWINPDESTGVGSMIVNKEGEYEIALAPDNTIQWAFSNTDPTWDWHNTGVVVELGEWSHVAVTYSGGNVVTYLNGVQVQSYSGTGDITDANIGMDELRIGGRQNVPAGESFNGRIADVRLWNSTRTAFDVASNMNSTLTGAESGLVGYWRLDENSTTATDLAGSNDGTLSINAAPSGYRVSADSTISEGDPGVLGNDYDADGDTLTVSEVNGNAIDVGNEIVLASGALLTLNTDGSFDYNTNGAFDSLIEGAITTDTFDYTVSDGSATDTATVTIQITGVDDAPVFDSTPVTAATEDTPYSYSITASDADGDTLSITAAAALPSWLVLVDHGNGSATLSGTPTNADVGSYPVLIQVHDGTVGTQQGFSIVVTNTNDAPVNTVPAAQSTDEDTSKVFSTANGNALSVADVDSATEELEVELAVTNGLLTLAGTTGLTFVSGDGSSDATMTFRGTAANINTALDGLAYAPTSDYTGGASLTLETRDFVQVVDNVDTSLVGRYSFENSGALGTDTSVAAGNDGSVSGATGLVDEERGNVLDLNGASFIQTTGLFGSPANVTVAAWVNLSIADSGGSEVISLGDSVILRVDETANGRGLGGFIYNGSTWVATTFNVTLANTGWQHIAYSMNDNEDTATLYLNGVAVASSPVTSSISYGSGVGQGDDSFIGKHANGQTVRDFTGQIDEARIYNRALTDEEIIALASDKPLTDSDSVSLTVDPVSDAPTFGSSPETDATEDEAYSYAITASDADAGSTLSITATSVLPSWLILTDNGDGTATLAGTPENADVDVYTIVLEVSDGANTDTQSFDITVANANDAPTFTSSPDATATEDAAYSYEITASDVDVGSTLSISATSVLPSWLILTDNGDGTATLAGTPENADVGTHSIVLEVSDGTTTDTQGFDIAVANTNDAPHAADDRLGVEFDGVFDHVLIGTDSSLEMTSSMTMEAWINPDETTHADRLIINREGEYEVGLAADNTIQWAFDNTDPNWGWHNTGVAVELGEWSHIAVTYNNGDVTTYLNGVQIDFYDGSGDIGDAHADKDELRIGGRENNPENQSFDGRIAEVRIWNSSRSAVDINTTMNSALTGTESNLVGYWRLDEDSSIATDLAGNNNGQLFFNASPSGYRVTEEGSISDSAPGVLTNDYDADGDTLTVSEVNGSAVDVGNEIVLTSGALLTLNPDGSFDYDTNGAFDSLIAGAITTDTFDYTVTDGSVTDTATVTIQITGVNDAPTFVSTPETDATEDSAYSYAITASDSDATDTITIAATSVLPSWLILTDNGGGSATLAGTPENADVGIYSIVLEVSDGTTIDTQSFDITVANTNDAPTFTSSPVIVATEDAAYNYAITTGDVDASDTHTISATSALPSWLILTDNGDGSATLTGTPENADVGLYSIVLEVFDGTTTDTQSFDITVANTNDAPTFTSSPVIVATEDAAYSYAITTGDVDTSDTHTISATSALPSWLVLTDNGDGSATLTGTPENADVGVHSIVLEVFDGTTTDTQSFDITVANTNDAPTFTSVPNTAATEDTAYNYAITASDIDSGSTLSITVISALPSWLNLTDNGDGSASLTGTPANADVGLHSIVLEVSDGTTTETQSFDITVTNTNDAPTFTSVPNTAATEDAAYNYAITASDIDSGSTLSITATSALPSWLNLTDNGDGSASLTGTPANADVGLHSIVLEVSDGTTTEIQSFDITVANTNDAPTFTSSPVIAATEDAPYSYAITTGDVDASDTHTISATSALPSWLVLTDNGDGSATLTGTPENADVGVHSIVLEVFDGTTTDTQSFDITVANTNDAPTFTSVPNTAATEDTAYNYAITASDIDSGSTLSITVISALPSWLNLTDNGDGSASLTGTPANADVGLHSIVLEVSDGTTTETQSFDITLANTNDAPTFTSSPVIAATEDAPYSYAITTGDVDASDTHTISATSALPSWLVLTDNGDGSATLTGTPENADVGLHSIVLEVSDGTTTDTQSFDITVANTNDAPTFTSSPVIAATEDAAYSYAITTGDVDVSDTRTISATSALPSWLTLTDNGNGSASLTGTPVNVDVGVYSVVLEVSDGTITDTQSFDITVANTNDAPTFTSSPIIAATEDAPYSYAVTAGDADAGSTLRITTASALPAWLVLTDNSDGSATLAGTPENADVGIHSIVLEVSDGTTVDTQSFDITVANTNDAPTFTSSPVIAATEDSAYSYTITATDVDASDTLTITTASALPSWLTLTDNGDGSATLTGTPANADVGLHSIVLEVSDGTSTDTQSFNITVANTNDAPTFTSSPVIAATEDSTYSYTIAASDVDATSTLTITAASTLPAWLTLTDNGNGNASLTGTPGSADVGSVPVELEVTDGMDTDTQSFTIVVEHVNVAPAFTSLATFTMAENSTSVGTASSSDPDGAAPVYSIVGAVDDSRFTIDAVSGELRFSMAPDFENPADNDGNNRYELTVQASDSKGGVATQTIVVTVIDVNETPAFSSPGTFTVSENSEFIATISSEDDTGSTQHYSLVGAGDDALFSIDATSGELSFIAAPDFESPLDAGRDNTYQLTVQTENELGVIATLDVSVTIENLNEAPVLASAELASSEGFIGNIGQLTVSDPDADDELTLSIIGGTGQAFFSLDSSSGTLTQQASLSPGVYTLEVQLNDANGMSTTAMLIIRIAAEPELGSANNTSNGQNIGTNGSAKDSESDTGYVPAATDNDTLTADNTDTLESSTESSLSGPAEPTTDESLPTSSDIAALSNTIDTLFAALPSETPDAATVSGTTGTEQNTSRGRGYSVILELLVAEADEAFDELGYALSNAIDSPLFSITLTPSMLRALSGMHSDVDEQQQLDDDNQQMIFTASTIASVTLTIGFISWLLQTGSLLATAMTTSSLWRSIDPVPVLRNGEDDDVHLPIYKQTGGNSRDQ